MDITLERVMSATASAISRERIKNAIAEAIIIIERVDRVINVIAVVILREHVMKAITVTLALLAMAIALPSIF
ncbi:MAG TPA: hypothetical protein DDW55_10720 [Gammaproteobacteria bacterium]|nr:hypothetical protein [Gammaproteobacteria bacterium]